MFFDKTTRFLLPEDIFVEMKMLQVMRRLKIIIFIVFLSSHLSIAQDTSNPEAILALTGATLIEELSQYEVERLEDYMNNPFQLNMMPLSRLVESGLLTHYQAVSFDDYRSRHGDVLSFAELAAVDGFSKDFVKRLSPFVSLTTLAVAGKTESGRPVTDHDLTIRGGLKANGAENNNGTVSVRSSYGVKYRLEKFGRFSAGFSVSRTYDSVFLTSGQLSWRFRRRQGQIIVGDYNARMGQGLILWNGMSVGGLSSPSAFLRRPSGLSASSSFTGNYSFRGIAGDIYVGRLRISSMLAAGDSKYGLSIMPAVNLSWIFRYGQISMTHYADLLPVTHGLRIPDMKTSADFGFCLSGYDIFGEIAYDWVGQVPAMSAGTIFPVGEDLRLAAMLRYFPPGFSFGRGAPSSSSSSASDEYAASFSGELSAGQWISVNGAEGFGSDVRRCQGTFSCDAACYPMPKKDDSRYSVQLKLQTDWSLMLCSAFKLKIRLAERMRSWGNHFRSEARAELSYLSRHLHVNMRINAVKCVGTGLLSYAECGYMADVVRLYVRGGLFMIDDWEDRIYVYEREAPGSFNVPAFYGRGYWVAFHANLKVMKTMKLYFRAALTEYPFMKQFKPGKAELKLQMTLDF